ncbi:MAG: tRNA 2-thiouridine(34) synthase MnmA, partial [Firmicutes bacterium]|nr:tRNA 2-thiouridine(34) synthase MnmA [Bacillota bacterium]
FAAEAKIRYGSTPEPCLVTPRPDGSVQVEFTNPQRAITPGQAVVFYQGDLVLGGGTIQRGR